MESLLFFHPNFYSLFSELIDNNVNIYVILTNKFLNNLLENHREVFIELIKNDLFHGFLNHHIEGVLSIALKEKYILMGF